MGVRYVMGTLVEQKRSGRELAAGLNQRGLLSGVKRAWDKHAVRRVRRRYGIPFEPLPDGPARSKPSAAGRTYRPKRLIGSAEPASL